VNTFPTVDKHGKPFALIFLIASDKPILGADYRRLVEGIELDRDLKTVGNLPLIVREARLNHDVPNPVYITATTNGGLKDSHEKIEGRSYEAAAAYCLSNKKARYPVTGTVTSVSDGKYNVGVIGDIDGKEQLGPVLYSSLLKHGIKV
jgi:hypothetical protein